MRVFVGRRDWPWGGAVERGLGDQEGLGGEGMGGRRQEEAVALRASEPGSLLGWT